MPRFGQARQGRWARGGRGQQSRRGWQAEPRIASWARTGGSWRDGDRRNSGPDFDPDEARDVETTGAIIGTLPYDTFYYPDDDPEPSPRITSCEFVASYNWMDSERPTIMIPGGPPTWSPPPGKPRIPKDDGEYFLNANAARWPKHPIEPAIRSVFELNKDFDTGDIDIVTTNTTIRCLFQYTIATAESFKIEVERIGNTVFMLCRQASPKALIQGIHGCGANFRDQYTMWASSLTGSLSNQRMVRYEFCGLRFLVHFTCDGYLEESAHNEIVCSADQATSEPQADGDTNISQVTNPAAIMEAEAAESGTLNILRGGFVPAQESIFDVKTRMANADIDMETTKQLLWAGQVPTLIAAYHRQRIFHDIRIQEVGDEIEAWEDDNKQALARLGRLFQRIISKTERPGTRKVCVCLNGFLEVREQAGTPRSMLPPDLEAKWAASENCKRSDVNADRLHRQFFTFLPFSCI